MKIVLGGSRFLEKIPQNLIELIKEWTDSGSEFLVGDAPGADSCSVGGSALSGPSQAMRPACTASAPARTSP